MRRLIVNADDFGLTSGVNRAIVRANSAGVVTSATLMANGRAFDGAIAAVKEFRNLRTGCHVNLIDGFPVVSGLKSLTDRSGKFKNSLKDFARAALRRKLAPEEIQKEAEAQIRRIQDCGIAITHVDSHKHTHIFPEVLRPILRAARACGIHAVRNPFEPLRAWPRGLIMATPALWFRCVGVSAFRLFGSTFRKAIAEAGMVTTDGTVGIAATGKLDEQMLLGILTALPEGTWELVCHPGYSDPELQAAGTRLTLSREIELEALTSESVKGLMARRGIELISFADL
ncbi:MAG: carbohydrate deacetylase [Candidatus Angelobacter sp.]